MTKASETVLQDALLLSISDRAELAAALLASLDGEPEAEVESAWAEEIERRAAQVRSGKASGRPWPEIREELERKRG